MILKDIYSGITELKVKCNLTTTYYSDQSKLLSKMTNGKKKLFGDLKCRTVCLSCFCFWKMSAIFSL